MQKIKNLIQKLKTYSLRRKIFLGIVFVLIIFGLGKNFLGKNDNKSFEVGVVKKDTLIQSVIASGQVVSEIDLDLSFNSSGVVKKINTKVGNKVYKGQILASLDQGSLLASLTQAQGALASAQAKYDKTIEGSSDKEVVLAQTLLDNAKIDYDNIKSEQDLLVDSAEDEYFDTISTNGANLLKAKNDLNYIKKVRESALISATSIINQRQAELDIKIASATDADIALAKADILSAQGQVQLANANLENSIIRAPASGTITKVDIKLGELAEAYKKSIVLEDIGNLYVEAKINEANISNIKIGNPVIITYDSLGGDKDFQGEVVFVDPSATTEEGIVNYKIKISLKEKNNLIKPGMNADINITTFKKENSLVVPFLAIKKESGLSYIKVVNDLKNNTYDTVPVEVGTIGDGNLVEIISGVNEGDSIIVSGKK